MKNIRRFVLPVLLILLVVAGIVAWVGFTNLMKPGFHTFAGYTRVDLQKKIYAVDVDTEVVGESTLVTIIGLVQPKKADGSSETFLGSVSVEKYPLSLEAGYLDFFAANNKMISITNQESADDPVTYWVVMSPKDPDVFRVSVTLEDGNVISFYPGETEEEALENCEAFWQWYGSWN